MDCSTPGFPVLHHLPEFAQTHVHWVGDAIQPFHPLQPPSPPALNPLQHQSLFQWVDSSYQVNLAWPFWPGWTRCILWPKNSTSRCWPWFSEYDPQRSNINISGEVWNANYHPHTPFPRPSELEISGVGPTISVSTSLLGDFSLCWSLRCICHVCTALFL